MADSAVKGWKIGPDWFGYRCDHCLLVVDADTAKGLRGLMYAHRLVCPKRGVAWVDVRASPRLPQTIGGRMTGLPCDCDDGVSECYCVTVLPQAEKPCDLEDPYANVHRIGLEREGWDTPPEAA